MKPRKVMVNLEILSDVSIKMLKEKERWVWKKGMTGSELVNIHQVTVQVVKGDR
jgi:hypothetical protein